LILIGKTQLINVFYGSTFVDKKYYFQRNKKEANPSILLVANLLVKSNTDMPLNLEDFKREISNSLSEFQKVSNNLKENWGSTHLLLHVQEARVDLKKPGCLTPKFYFTCKILPERGILLEVVGETVIMDVIIMPEAVKSYSTNVWF